MFRLQSRETRLINSVLKTAFLYQEITYLKMFFGNDGRRQKALKSSEEITKLKESTSAHKSFAEMGGSELTT